jgi:hypothetical protein
VCVCGFVGAAATGTFCAFARADADADADARRSPAVGVPPSTLKKRRRLGLSTRPLFAHSLFTWTSARSPPLYPRPQKRHPSNSIIKSSDKWVGGSSFSLTPMAGSSLASSERSSPQSMDAQPSRARTFGDSAAAAAAGAPPPPPTPLDAAAALATTLLAVLLWVAVGWVLLVAVSDVGFLQALRFAKKRCVFGGGGRAASARAVSPTPRPTGRPTRAPPPLLLILIIINNQYSAAAPPAHAPTRIDNAAAAEEIERLRVSCFGGEARRARDGRPRRRRSPRPRSDEGAVLLTTRPPALGDPHRNT